jgi:hypothetical protein
MPFTQPTTEIIKKRFSCRNYLDLPINQGKRQQLTNYISAMNAGPFGHRPRFKLVTATKEDRNALKNLGTYGFIRGATGFIIGAIKNPEQELEDFGYLMEKIILYATDLELGTCWIGGTFTKSSFSKKISASDEELVPAVTSIGHIPPNPDLFARLVRRGAQADRRFPWDKLFYEQDFGCPISRERLGDYAIPFEMVRIGPSASNQQPWRIVEDGIKYHFYLQRTPGYRETLWGKLVKVADLQRIDMGIAMNHFEETTLDLGLKGHWEMSKPEIKIPDELTEYTASWVGDS